MFSPGDCIHIATGEDDFGYIQFHLFVVLTDPHPETDAFILANFSTIRGGFVDGTVICRADDHEFLANDSYVDYYYARIETVESLQELIQSEDAKQIGHRIEGDLLGRIQYGILDSEHTPFEVRDAFQEYLDGLAK